MEELKSEKEFKLKKFFYALRSVTACKWIVDREEMPPIVFQKMLDGLTIEKNVLDRIAELVELKSKSSEGYMHHGEELLFEFIESCIKHADQNKKSLPSSTGNSDDLDSFFTKHLP